MGYVKRKYGVFLGKPPARSGFLHRGKASREFSMCPESSVLQCLCMCYNGTGSLFQSPTGRQAAPSLIEQEKRMETQTMLGNRYERIYMQLQELLPKSRDIVAHMATAAALLHHKMPHYFWTGFYLLKHERLVVGPYQGPVACQVLAGPDGVWWAGFNINETSVVRDVHRFPGPVACDSRSNSEIVVPLFREDESVWAVLDVDSIRLDAFSEVDAAWLEKITRLLTPEA